MTAKAWGILCLLAGSAWAASPAAGDWIGTLKAGGAELRVVLHVKEADGKLSATLDSIDQGANGIPIDSIAFADKKLTFDSNAISGHYEGTYDAAKPAFTGTWTQNGNSLPLTLERYVEKPKPARTGPAAKPSDIDGTWEGKLDTGAQTLRIVFHIKTDEDGNLTATTDSPDQNASGIPVTTVKRDGNNLKMEIKGIGAEYEGAINDAKNTIDGKLRQGGAELPLVLERKPAVGQDWRLWTPRAEIAPVHHQIGDELILEGGGNPAVFGGWERTFGEVKPGQWYRFEVRYKPSGLDYEPLQVPVRLDWLRANGKRAGQPDYAWRVSPQGDSRLVTIEAPAPEEAASVKAQLLLENAPRAKIRWSGATFVTIPTPGPRKVRIAAIRLHPNGTDPVAHFLESAEAKVPDGADVVLFPEGVTLVGTGKTYADVAEAVPGPTTERLGAFARRTHVWVVAGLLERDGSAIYNTAVLIDRNGKYAGKYRKVYLPREEFEGGLTPGSEFPVFDTDFGKIGMMICWDVQYADPARGLALRGAELILMPIWGGSEPLARARAIENHVFLASSGFDFPSAIYDPVGETLARTEQDGTVATATIDLNRRYVDPWLGDMRGRFFRELRGDVAVDPRSHSEPRP